MQKILVYSFLFLLVLTGCSSVIPDNPTAKTILKEDAQADILQFDHLIYIKAADQESLIKNNFIRGDKIGVIKKTTTSTLFFKDFYATKLPIGSEIFATNNHDTYTIIVEIDGKQILYKALLEG
ncbi:hypothetical protein AMS59_17595 [Lysinibacillus sp. FJAT-14745]|uniref:hypothetical protein n=1 Tax=Lysinibacillus sp. FJAT-14745 TaxID=1704289 RepID=UPI0006ABA4C9|nr:hypothetical protein [Lysinibacillus sp. FJAT-14745]KOP72718.1 hypothetical protein AMS59_17595 [Lysinibacillus sp. FJAT-14745]